MIATKLDYSSLMSACGLAGQNGEKSTINRRITHYLEKSLEESAAEFTAKIAKSTSKIQHLSLQNYKTEQEFRTAWQFIALPPPLSKWDFLSHTDPEKSGILCGKSEEAPILLTEETVHPLWEMETSSVTGIEDLWLSLSWWRETICAIWAGKIIHNLFFGVYKNQKRYLPGGISQKSAERTNEKIPIGTPLTLPGISQKEAEKFYNLCNEAHMGSITCEYESAAALKEWLRRIDIDTLKNAGATFDQAYVLLLAGSARDPRVDVELIWNQEKGSYELVCLVKNNDTHGYVDKKKTSNIPVEILAAFFTDAPREVQEDLLRLTLRAGHIKARELIRKSLDRDLD